MLFNKPLFDIRRSGPASGGVPEPPSHPAPAMAVRMAASKFDGSFDPKSAFRLLEETLPPRDADGLMDLAEVTKALCAFWERFYPAGVRLTSDEVEEINIMFEVWASSQGYMSISCVEFVPFRSWFLTDVSFSINRAAKHRIAPIKSQQIDPLFDPLMNPSPPTRREILLGMAEARHDAEAEAGAGITDQPPGEEKESLSMWSLRAQLRSVDTGIAPTPRTDSHSSPTVPIEQKEHQQQQQQQQVEGITDAPPPWLELLQDSDIVTGSITNVDTLSSVHGSERSI